MDQSYDHTDYPMFNILNMLVGWESFPHGYTALEILYYILECNTLQYYVKKEDRLEAIHTMVKLVEKNDPGSMKLSNNWNFLFSSTSTGSDINWRIV